MSAHKISWLNIPGYKGETWNPIIGCSHVSSGCDNCYAEKMAFRIANIELHNQGKNGYHYSNVVKVVSGGWMGNAAASPVITELMKEHSYGAQIVCGIEPHGKFIELMDTPSFKSPGFLKRFKMMVKSLLTTPKNPFRGQGVHN